MIKGIVLFDLQDFLYQGTKGLEMSVEKINERQSQALGVVHTKMRAERQRRLSSRTHVPTVDIFLPTGDGYYLLCSPALTDILDIALCIMAILHSSDIKAYCVAHVGEINMFTDMTGRENATGFDLGYASRLQSLSRETGKLTCSENLSNVWEDNQFFHLEDSSHPDIAKDGIEYPWKLAVPKDFEAVSANLAR
ncbi:MAG: hypothetical protein IIC21_12380 [Chloroflexi bacterium]|nr:hypothetical protein [Chloroflexota bacterium]